MEKNDIMEQQDIDTMHTADKCGDVQKGDVGMCRHTKATPRPAMLRRTLQSRLNRAIGQMNGIKKMIDENRYCGDVLMQISAVESALKAIGNIIMQDHLHTCVAERVREGDESVLDEAMELMKKLK